jgi:hypothetical protein
LPDPSSWFFNRLVGHTVNAEVTVHAPATPGRERLPRAHAATAAPAIAHGFLPLGSVSAIGVEGSPQRGMSGPGRVVKRRSRLRAMHSVHRSVCPRRKSSWSVIHSKPNPLQAVLARKSKQEFRPFRARPNFGFVTQGWRPGLSNCAPLGLKTRLRRETSHAKQRVARQRVLNGMHRPQLTASE